ncbi:unnamed protein product [Auanema sp. JU1783]|nr:unnamed protein product [Auanema sp. JU1783]
MTTTGLPILAICEPSIFNDIQKTARLFGGMPIAVLGMITNTINIIVFIDPEMRCSLVNHFLLVLSVSDLLLLICNFFMLTFPVIASMSDSVALHDTYPNILWYSFPIGLSTQTCGVYLTVLVSVHRYLGVCHPFRAKRWVSGKPVKCAIIGSIIFSIVINIHTWFELNTAECYSKEFQRTIQTIRLTELKTNHTYNVITRCILYTLVMFVIPFIALIIVNWKIIVALKESTRMRNLHSSRKTNQSRLMHNFRLLRNAKYSELFGKFSKLNFNPLRNPSLLKTNGNSVRDRSVTLMLLAIVAIFLCCNCLAFCNNIYEIVRDATAAEDISMEASTSNNTEAYDSASSQDTFDFSVELSNILISLNSSSSMFVYLIFSSKYRSIIKHWLGLEKRKKVNGVALTTAMVAQKALELSILPDEAEARRNRREARLGMFIKKTKAIRNQLTSAHSVGSVNDVREALSDENCEVVGEAGDDLDIDRDSSHRTSSRRKLLRFATIQ